METWPFWNCEPTGSSMVFSRKDSPPIAEHAGAVRSDTRFAPPACGGSRVPQSRTFSMTTPSRGARARGPSAVSTCVGFTEGVPAGKTESLEAHRLKGTLPARIIRSAQEIFRPYFSFIGQSSRRWRSASRFFSSSTKTADLEYRCRIAPSQQRIYHLVRDAVLSTGGILKGQPGSLGRHLSRHRPPWCESGPLRPAPALGLIRDAR